MRHWAATGVFPSAGECGLSPPLPLELPLLRELLRRRGPERFGGMQKE